MKRTPKGTLELTWMGKDSALVPVEDGQYNYAWVDRFDPRAREIKTIEIVDRIGKLDFSAEEANNLLVAGDSGDVLRALGNVPEYSKHFLGKVKLVYIDPPFNTEQTFANYDDHLEHSIWLTMMRDRVKDIRPLMAEDASIWVHLDDVEVHRMRIILDEEFGAENFVATIVWQKKYSRDNRPAIGSVHDYILVYALQGPQNWKNVRNRVARVNATQYRNPNNDPSGPWRPIPLDVQGGHATASQFYDVITPSGKVVRPANGRAWSVTEPVMEAMRQAGEVYFGLKGDGMPNTIRYLKDDQGLVPWTWWPHEEVGNNDEAKKEIIDLFGDDAVFDTPKPERLMERIIQIGSDPGDLILDCFAGSGTTAAVAHKLGRRWVTVELNASNVERYTRPRLERVIAGTDDVGISTRPSVSFVDEKLTGLVKPDDARVFLRVLNAMMKVESETLDENSRRALNDEMRTRLSQRIEPADVTSGGGFVVARVGPSMFDVDDADGEVYLSDHAVNGAWAKAVAGQLRFTLTPHNPVFCGVKNRQRLAVIDGVADENVIRTVVEHLMDRERAVIVAKSVLPDAENLLNELSPGSRIRKAPDQLILKGTIK